METNRLGFDPCQCRHLHSHFLPEHQAEAITAGSSGNRTAKAPENSGLIDWGDWILGVYAYIYNCNIQSNSISNTICFSCSPYPHRRKSYLTLKQGWCGQVATIYRFLLGLLINSGTSMLSCLDPCRFITEKDAQKPLAKGLPVIASTHSSFHYKEMDSVPCSSGLFPDLVHFDKSVRI